MIRFAGALKALGILVLLAVLVAAGAAGGVYWYLAPKLPSAEILRDVRLQVPLRVYTREGELIAEFGEKRRTPLRLDEVPEQLIQAFLAGEDDRYFEHPRGRLAGPDPRRAAPRPHRREGARRQHHHHAGGPQLLPHPREDLHPQAQRDPARAEDRARVHQGRDPGALRQQDLPRPSRLWGRRRGTGLLRAPGHRARARPGRDDRGAAEGAIEVQPRRRSGAGGGAAELRAAAHAGDWLHHARGARCRPAKRR